MVIYPELGIIWLNWLGINKPIINQLSTIFVPNLFNHMYIDLYKIILISTSKQITINLPSYLYTFNHWCIYDLTTMVLNSIKCNTLCAIFTPKELCIPHRIYPTCYNEKFSKLCLLYNQFSLCVLSDYK